LTAIGLAAAGLAAFGPGTALAGTLDQQQTDAGGGTASVSITVSQAQTFTAGIRGGVDQVDLHLSTVTTTTPLIVEIRDSAFGIPGTTVLASGSIPAAQNLAPTFVPVQFATPAPVIPGTSYAIVAYTADIGWAWGHRLSGQDLYQGGQALSSATSPPSVFLPAAPTFDFAFKTYVAPSPPTGGPGGPSGKRAAALKKCKKKKSKKAKKKCKKKAKKLPA
jgi:hypothetical protein